MKLDVLMEIEGALALKASELKAHLAQTLMFAGEYWHRHFRKRHFHPIAFRIYRYTPRSKGYTARKWKKLKHANPLVFTGVSRRLSEFKKVKATHEKVDVTMPTRAFNFRAKGSQVNMRDEATQINDDEHATLNDQMKKAFEFSLKYWKGKQRVRTRDARGRFIKG